MKKTIVLHPYNPAWPKMYEVEAADIKAALGSHCIAVHHIGSTSVPGLTAKEDLDIMCIVDDLKSSLILQDIGYVYKGEINIPLRNFFSKNSERSKVNLHVVEPDHGFIPLNLTYRDYLRTHDDVRDAYGALKLELVKDDAATDRIAYRIPRYTLDKHQFIVDVLEKAGFDDFTINFCFHTREWEAYHRIRHEQWQGAYDPKDPIYKAENHYHFVFYRGINIVAVAHVELVHSSKIILREMLTDTPYQSKGYDEKFAEIIKKWVKAKDYSF
jgi:GrpB-like predicted nucleotidyltransferase (UPF0157 family)